MRAGTLRETITIQAQGTTSSPEWGPSTAWTDVATIRASVLATTADEDFEQKGVATATRYTVKTRHRDLSPANRLVWRGLVLDIVGIVDPDGRRRELEIKAVAHG